MPRSNHAVAERAGLVIPTPYSLPFTDKWCIEMGWLDKFAKGLEEFAGKPVKANIMKAAPDAFTGKTAGQITEWLLAAIDTLVPDEETRRSIMLCCSDTFPEKRIQRLRAECENRQCRRAHQVDASG